MKRMIMPFVFALFVSGVVHGQSGPHVWSQKSFADFSKGHFDDAGANTYVSAKGRIQQIHRWDLNCDGNIDLVFCNTHAQSERLDAALFWGNGKDFDISRISYIPNDGAQWTIAADLDGDGNLDAVIPNYTNGTWSKMESCVYYGGMDELRKRSASSTAWGFPPFARKISLPTEAAQKAAVADLNGDGYPDIVFALSAGYWEYRGGKALASPSRIFWGSKTGFDRTRFTDLDASGATDVAIADLNKDGWPDIVLANRENNGKFDIASYIYWGSKEGFSASRRTELPTNQVNAVAIADVNNDGFPDIIFANGVGTTSFIYTNDHGAFDAHRRIELPTSEAHGCAAADVNKDGWTDIFFTNFQTAGNRETNSYLYFGGPDGFSASHRQEFETIGASGVSIGDLNEDGLPDIVVSNFGQATSLDVPSYIFWNSKNGFSNSLRTSLFTHGAVGNTIADFDGDGHPDVIFNNTMRGQRGGVAPMYIYWGDEKGNYSPERRQELPSVETYGWGAADLNDDGWPDLIVANQAETGRHVTENFIYWGSEKGFSVDNRSAVIGNGSKSINVADLDGDGYLDLIVLNKTDNDGVMIYWGSAAGYVTTSRSQLWGPGVGFPAVADLNGDGHLDVIVSGGDQKNAVVYWGDGTRNFSAARSSEIPDSKGTSNVEIADMNRDGFLDVILTRRGQEPPPSYIYYGNAKGEFSVERRCQFKPIETQGVTVADVNQDGWLDVICPCYSYNGSRETMSRIYLGGPDGLSENHVIELPTNGGTGSMLADFNHDGYPDLLLTCHRAEGDSNKIGSSSDHITDSFLYWGGPDGFRPDRKLNIPTRGAHYDSGVDLGNIYDRRNNFNYVSVPHHYENAIPERIDWRAIAPHGTTVRLQTRSAEDESALEHAPWVGTSGAGHYYDQPGLLERVPAEHRWIQYRIVFSSPSGADSASVDQVSLSFK